MTVATVKEKEARPAGLRSPTPERLVVELNDHWRVVDAPPHWPGQWILQRKKGSSRPHDDGWVGNAYCVTSAALRRNISERCGDVDRAAMAVVASLPERHPGSRGDSS
jgi:hypothetical protein